MEDGYLKTVEPGAVGQNLGTYIYNVQILTMLTFVTKELFGLYSILDIGLVMSGPM